jgi:hypothetical protein
MSSHKSTSCPVEIAQIDVMAVKSQQSTRNGSHSVDMCDFTELAGWSGVSVGRSR